MINNRVLSPCLPLRFIASHEGHVNMTYVIAFQDYAMSATRHLTTYRGTESCVTKSTTTCFLDHVRIAIRSHNTGALCTQVVVTVVQVRVQSSSCITPATKYRRSTCTRPYCRSHIKVENVKQKEEILPKERHERTVIAGAKETNGKEKTDKKGVSNWAHLKTV